MERKKELKAKYKEKKFRVGVFQIRNTTNNKVFIEASTDLDSIWNRHKFQLKIKSHQNSLLQADWNELGEDKFVFEILSEIKQEDDKSAAFYKSEVNDLAKLFFDELKPYNEKGYHKPKAS